jgi:hypothetical protein
MPDGHVGIRRRCVAAVAEAKFTEYVVPLVQINSVTDNRLNISTELGTVCVSEMVQKGIYKRELVARAAFEVSAEN